MSLECNKHSRLFTSAEAGREARLIKSYQALFTSPNRRAILSLFSFSIAIVHSSACLQRASQHRQILALAALNAYSYPSLAHPQREVGVTNFHKKIILKFIKICFLLNPSPVNPGLKANFSQTQTCRMTPKSRILLKRTKTASIQR